MSRLTSIVIIAVTGACAATAAEAREKRITPYIEVGQVLTADLNNGSDLLTYTSVAAGVDVSLQSRRTEVQVSYRYEHRFSESRALADQDIHQGLARAAVRVGSGVSLEGGALATRARSDIRGSAPGLLNGNVSNISQLYSFYAGPTIGTHIGPVGVSGGYRFGYTKVESPTIVDALAVGQPRLDTFDSVRNHQAQLSLNLKSGAVLPVGVTVSGAFDREDGGQLRQTYEGKYGRGDVLYPVSRSLALTAGVGYENILATQRNALFDANGQPVLDRRGRFVTDNASAPRIAYQFDGIYYDAGVIWRPSARTVVEARAGERYGSFSFTGSVNYQASRKVAVRVGVYDGVQTFGRQLRSGLSNVSTSFTPNTDPLSGNFNGCVFGAQGGAAGNCLNGVLQSISTSVYRARGVDGVVTYTEGRTTIGFGAGYANRRFSAPRNAGFSIDAITDESYYAQAFFAHSLDRDTTVNINSFFNYYTSGIRGAGSIYSAGTVGSLSHNFGRLGTRASLGVYGANNGLGLRTVSLEALLGARYSF